MSPHLECISWGALACVLGYRVGSFVMGRRMSKGLDALRELAASRGRLDLAHELTLLVTDPDVADGLRGAVAAKCCAVIREDDEIMRRAVESLCPDARRSDAS